MDDTFTVEDTSRGDRDSVLCTLDSDCEVKDTLRKMSHHRSLHRDHSLIVG